MAADLPPDFEGINEMMQQMKSSMEKIEKTLGTRRISGVAGAGLVKVVVNGKHEFIRTLLDNAVLKEKKETIEELITAACNDAMQKVEELSKQSIMDLSKSFDSPLKKLPSKDE